MNYLLLGAFTALLTTQTAQAMSDLERDAKALELYLQDKKDHKEHCSNVQWEQPGMAVYKKKLESQLPKGCKK